MIEAISLTKLNILYDVCFNKEIGLDGCFYFKDDGSLTKLLDNKKLLDKNRDKMGNIVYNNYINNFTWDKIVDKYKNILK